MSKQLVDLNKTHKSLKLRIYPTEEHNYAKALECSGLDWNMFIKDYVLRGMREDLMKLDASSCTTLFQYIPILELGMFNTVAAALNATTYTNTDLEALRVNYIHSKEWMLLVFAS